MSTMTIQLSDELKGQLSVVARRSGKTPARFVREILEHRLKARRVRVGHQSSLYDLSRDLCGSAKGGPRDLASNKKHLNGYGSCKR